MDDPFEIVDYSSSSSEDWHVVSEHGDLGEDEEDFDFNADEGEEVHELDHAVDDDREIDLAGEPVGDEEERDSGDSEVGDLSVYRDRGYQEMADDDGDLALSDYCSDEMDRFLESLNDELVPWSVAGRLKRDRMWKKGKFQKHRNRINQLKPGSICGKHGFGRKHLC